MTVWLFDLDNTLHDAGKEVFGALRQSMSAYMQRELQLSEEQARHLHVHYWQRYGATLIGLIRHHGVKPAHFLHDTHLLPGLETMISGHRHDFAALKALRGRKFILTNAPRDYALRVLRLLRIKHLFDGVLTMEDMRMFGELRPKPDARMLRRLVARLGVPASQCVLVEDTLEHQKSARRVGMRTVWMQRYLRRGGAGLLAQPRWSMQPAYVDRVVRRLRVLARG